MEKQMSNEYPKYYSNKDGFGANILYVVRMSETDTVVKCKDGTERGYQWDLLQDRFVQEGSWIEIPKQIVESGNLYAFLEGRWYSEQPAKANVCHGTRVIATVTSRGLFKFAIEANDKNAEEFVACIERFLHRRINAIEVQRVNPEPEPAGVPI
jgi:hypothetical protein